MDRPPVQVFAVSAARMMENEPSFDAIIDPRLKRRTIPHPELILEKVGNYWPDSLSPSLSHLPMVWSERVIQAIQREDLTGLDFREVSLKLPLFSRWRRVPCKYFMVSPLGAPLDFTYEGYMRTEGDRYEFVFETEDDHDSRFREGPGGAFIYRRRIPKPRSRSFDFIRIEYAAHLDPIFASNTLVFGGFYVSRRVVELAASEKWTNFEFCPLDCLSMRPGGFLGRPWPPELWYAEGHP